MTDAHSASPNKPVAHATYHTQTQIFALVSWTRMRVPFVPGRSHMTDQPTSLCLGQKSRGHPTFSSGFPGPASMTRRFIANLPLEPMWKGSTRSRTRVWSRLPLLSPTWANDSWPLLGMITGLFKDVFLPFGQTAVGTSGAIL